MAGQAAVGMGSRHGEPKGPICTLFLGCICSFFIGLSVFVSTESIFVQNNLFTYCFNEGKQFVGYSGMFLFLPGLLVNLVNPSLSKCRTQIGLRTATFISVACSNIIIWLALGGYFLLEYNQTEMADQFAIFGLEIVIGLCVSFCFASHTPLMSILPPSFYVAFSLGLYAPSTVVMLPASALAGDLCSCMTIKNISASNSSGGFQCTHCQYSVDWMHLLEFYIPVAGAQVVGLVSYFIVSGLPIAKKQLDAVNGRQTNPVQIKRRRIISAEGASSGVSTDSQDPFMLRRGSDLSQAFLLDDVVGGDAVDADDESSTPRTSHCSVLRLVRVQFTTIVFNTIASQCLVGLIPYLECDEVKDLDTLLIYLYYGCTALGVVICFIPAVTRAPPYILLSIALTRSAYTVFIFVLVATNMAGILSTYALIAIHILSYILGGLTFSASFPSAVQQFRDAKKQMVASGLLNIAYFLSISVTGVPELFLPDASGSAAGPTSMNVSSGYKCFT